MKKYEKVTKSYEMEEISECTCDKCGEKCEYRKFDTFTDDKRTLVEISPQYTGGDKAYLDLCPKCTKELLSWFPKNEQTEELLFSIDIWEKD